LPASDFEWLLLWLHAPEPEKMTSAPGPSILEIRRGECLLAREQLSIGENHLLAKNRCRDGVFGDTLEFRMNGHLALAAIAPDTRQLSWLFRRMEMMSVPSRTEISRARERSGP